LRTLLLVPALLAACLAATASAANVAADNEKLVPLRVDGFLATTERALPAGRQAAEWGGPTVASNGETVTIFFSGTYPVDTALQQKWVNFVASLVHGPEISTVSIHIAPLAEVQRFCGSQALACYSGRSRTIYSPGESPEAQLTAEGTLAHEFGHHVAANRVNSPFSALDYGTKRWSSYENVCSRSEQGALFPGAEDYAHYSLNPGEAFAESYRVLNEHRLGLPEDPWSIVTESLYPDPEALARLEQDVLTPWTANTTTTLKTVVSGKGRARTVPIEIPYDGTLSVRARKTGTTGPTVSVSVLSKGLLVGTTAFKSATSRTLTTTVCGQRSLNLQVKLGGKVTKATKATTVTLTVSAPY
jgi:hypothetical protein